MVLLHLRHENMYEAQYKWAKNNPEKVREIQKNWREKNKERKSLLDKLWKANNREKVNANSRKYRLKKLKERLKNDPIYAEKYKKYCFEKANFIISNENVIPTKLRFQVLQRDNFTCQYCGRKAPEVILHVDHKQPKSKQGKFTIDNLITACAECNVGKGNG